MKHLILFLTLLALATVNAEPLQYTINSKVDHFTSDGQSPTFKLRYLVDDQYFKDPKNINNTRPILFYTGNEGDIWQFYENSGFMTTTLAEKWGGLVVFCEHRYFGQSWPVKQKTAFEKGNNVYLTVDNTMMDFVDLVKFIKGKYNAQNKAVITFGGSYGGMLSAWIRMKHPHVFQGALAASAPILQFVGAPSAPSTGFYDIVSEDFNKTYADGRCGNGIKEGFLEMMKLKTQTDTWAGLSKIFQTCETVKSTDDIDTLYNYINSAYVYLAMIDYPYENSFLMPVPAWPVNASCQAFENINKLTPDTQQNLGALTPRQFKLFTALLDSARVYYDWNNKTDYCLDFKGSSTGALQDGGWDILTCNQLPMNEGIGNNTMFIPAPYNQTYWTEHCQKTYGLTPDYEWALREFGGFNLEEDFISYSNIIFSNGAFDPWRAGGVNEYINLKLPYFLIRNGAHHLDMRLPQKSDEGTDVAYVREKETEIIATWIEDYQTVMESHSNDGPIGLTQNQFIQ